MRDKHVIMSSMRSARVGDVIKGVLPPACRQRVFSLELLRWKWSALVGRELALRSEPHAVGGGVLTVAVNDAVWGRMILKLQKEILPRIATVIGSGRVRRIQFIRRERPLWNGGQPPPPRRPAAVDSVADNAPEPVVAAARSIKDAGLRSVVTRAASRYLAAQAARRK